MPKSLVLRGFSGVFGASYTFTAKNTHTPAPGLSYFICIDRTLQKAEAERIRKNSNNRDAKYNNDLAYTWNNVDLPALAQDLAHYARVGLDMMEDNTLFPIPYSDEQEVIQKAYDINSSLKVTVRFTPDDQAITVSYSQGYHEPFKVKSHLANRRALNAISDTLAHNGFTF